MSFYALVLFMHVSAVLVLCAALSIEVLSLIHLRGASTLDEASPWINPAPKLPLLAGRAVLVILVSGIYLVLPVLPSGQAWPKVAVVALLLMAPLGAITGKRMRAIQKAYEVEKRTNSELLDRLRDPALKVSLSIRIAVFFAIFTLVSIKPGLWEIGRWPPSDHWSGTKVSAPCIDTGRRWYKRSRCQRNHSYERTSGLVPQRAFG